MTADEIRDGIAAHIRRAFQNVNRKGGVSLHEADVIDDYGSETQKKQARTLDTENSWEQVPWDDIQHFHWALSFLDPIGFRYYLPAYMVFALHNPNTESAESVIFQLSVGTGNPKNHSTKRFELLNDDQSCAVCEFLRYEVAREQPANPRSSARKALKYWNRFCNRDLRGIGKPN
jgi:hypothetical protein